MMQINIWVFLASIVVAIIVGGVGTSVFIKPDLTSVNTPVIAQDCKPEKKETFRRGVKPNNTGLGKEY